MRYHVGRFYIEDSLEGFQCVRGIFRDASSTDAGELRVFRNLTLLYLPRNFTVCIDVQHTVEAGVGMDGRGVWYLAYACLRPCIRVSYVYLTNILIPQT